MTEDALDRPPPPPAPPRQVLEALRIRVDAGQAAADLLAGMAAYLGHHTFDREEGLALMDTVKALCDIATGDGSVTGTSGL